jgi:hypothetical protein
MKDGDLVAKIGSCQFWNATAAKDGASAEAFAAELPPLITPRRAWG